MIHPFSLALGAAFGAFVGWMAFDRSASSSDEGQSYGDGPTLHGKIVPGAAGSPSGPLVPRAGYASREDYEWGYLVGPGDSLEGIAQAITGNDGHYQELLLGNPQLKTIGEGGVYLGDNAWGVAPGQIVEGEALLLPVPWSRYIDQAGHPRGVVTPWPKDPRAPGVLVGHAETASLPYDRPFALGAAA